MKRNIFLLAALAAALLCTSCLKNLRHDPNEPKKTHKIDDIGDFDKISVQAPCELIYEPSDSVKVVVSGGESLVDNIAIVNEDGRLIIKEKKNDFFHNGSVKVVVRSQALQALDLEGAGSAQLKGEIKSDALSFNMNGAGSIMAESIHSDVLKVNVDGTGSVSLQDVTANDISMTMNGVGSVDATFSNSGSLNCAINGVGTFNLKGQVKSYKCETNGVGSVNTKELQVGDKVGDKES